ncbi:MAG: FAD-dependent oxidoreductase [Rikenellaceae bacterium]
MKKIFLAAWLLLTSITLFAQTDTVRMWASDHKENWLYLGDGSNPQPIRNVELSTEVVVVGGGMSGISAAVAAARQGAAVVLVQDRPVLGGNASSEIRMTVNGAPFERETGVVEELLIANLLHNPQHSHHVWDHILYNYVVAEPNIKLLLNTSAQDLEMDGNRIVAINCYQAPTESKIRISAPVFIDTTGDGFIGAKAGAEYRTGREGKEEFGEKFAPDQPDGWVMGETIMMITKDMGRPVPFIAPDYAIPYHGSDDKHRKIKQVKEGYWWVELGSNYDIIQERDQKVHDLMARFYGVWDYVKNSGNHPEAANIALDWVGSLPGKRESRRLVGDYMLTDVDQLSHAHFDDAVAYGGWSLDEHCEGGILSLHKPASYFHARFEKYYEVPYRCLYSRNIENLFMAGRCASVSHVAQSSTRIIGTCATMGMATGVAAAMCSEYSTSPRGIYESHIDELQERMLREDYFIPNRPADDPDNLVKRASKFTASSTASGDVMNLFDGVSRPVDGVESHWESEGTQATLNVEWKRPVTLSSVEFKFDTDLKRSIMMHKDEERNAKQLQSIPPELVKTLTIEAKVGKEWQTVAVVEDNIRRYLAVDIDQVEASALRINLQETHGANSIKMFELRCY